MATKTYKEPKQIVHTRATFKKIYAWKGKYMLL